MSISDIAALESTADRPVPAGAAATAAAKPLAPGVRDQRLDMFRGLALVMIFINHIPGTAFEHYTNRNFGFSDAAEAFVLMSGMAAGLAYSSGFRTGPLWPAVAKVWARARQLYFVHITTTAMAIAIFAAAALYFGITEVLTINNLKPLFQTPLEAIIGIPTLGHQLGYFNILPLYFSLLVATPLFLVVGLRRPWLLLAGSIALWALAGQFRINLPAYPNPGGWFFNPFSWQLIFVVGLLAGVGMKRGIPFFAYNRVLFWVCVVYLLVVLVWVKEPDVGDFGRSILGFFSKLGVPFYITWFDKTFLALPRLSHALALAYVLANLGWVRHFAESRYAEPLRLLGRNGLAVFATGSVLCMVGQAMKIATGDNNLPIDTLIIGIGLAMQLLLAWSLTATARMRAAARPAR